jgi:tetratricopeptide (TPR) repeat protein
MDFKTKVEFNAETIEGIDRLMRFLALPAEYGYTFASAKDERLIPSINRELIAKGEKQGRHFRLLFLENNPDAYLLGQMERGSTDADALIIPNFGSLINWLENADTPEDHRIISQLNFAREGINNIGKPILFWASEKLIAVLSRQAQDLFSQRRLNTVYFEQPIPMGEEGLPVRLLDFERDVDELSVEELLLRQASLGAQLEVAERLKWPEERIASELAIPLAVVTSQLRQHDEALDLLDRYYNHLMHPPVTTLLQCLLVELRGGRKNALEKYFRRVFGANRKPEEDQNIYGQIAKESAKSADPYLYVTALRGIGNALKDQGNLEAAEEAFHAYLANVEHLVASNPTVWQIQRHLGIAHDEIGKIQFLKGNIEDALRHSEISLEIHQRLAETTPSSKLFQHNYSIGLERIGKIYQSQGKLDEAMEAFQKVLRIRLRLTTANPASEELQYALAVAYDKVGFIHGIQGRTEEALESFQKALEIVQILVAAKPNSQQLQRSLSVYYERIGLIQFHHDFEKALIEFQKALDLRQKLALANSSSIEFHMDLHICLINLARLHYRWGDKESSLQFLHKALAQIEFISESRGTADDLILLERTKNRIATLNNGMHPSGW